MEIKQMKKTLAQNGYCVLKRIFSDIEINHFRAQVFQHLQLFPNTRPNPSSRHLAGFHRYPQLNALHSNILCNDTIVTSLNSIINKQYISIGLTDITINRSQQWHSDLLRGKYKNHLNINDTYNKEDGGVYKVLVYLQEGKNLKVIPGSHNTNLPLDDNLSEDFAQKNKVENLYINKGDAIIMDIRLQHRGATEEEMKNKQLDDEAKILITTVVGDTSKKLTHQMMLGNTYRQIDWDTRHLNYTNANEFIYNRS